MDFFQNKNLEESQRYTDQTNEREILSQIQHFGGDTNLIDFTTDYLIALFFACDAAMKEDGRVILLQKSDDQMTRTYASGGRALQKIGLFPKRAYSFNRRRVIWNNWGRFVQSKFHVASKSTFWNICENLMVFTEKLFTTISMGLLKIKIHRILYEITTIEALFFARLANLTESSKITAK